MLKKCALFCFLLSSIIYGENYISLQPIILDYSYGAIYSKELKGANHNRQLMSSYGVGVGVSYGNLRKAFYAKLKFDYNNHKYNILKDSVDSKDLALIFSLSFGPDFLLRNCVSIDFGIGPALIYFNKNFIYTYKNKEVTLLNNYYLGLFADFFVSYGVRLKVGFGVSYYYWHSDNFVFGLDNNLNPLPLQGKQRRQYVRPYVRVQVGQ